MKMLLKFLPILLALTPSIALANPVPTSIFDITWNLFPILSIEALIIFILLGWKNFDIARFTLAWLAITFFTYMCLGLFILFCMILLENYIGVTVTGEIIIVIVEAIIIKNLLTSDVTMKKPINIGTPKAVLISFLANAVSLELGIIVRDIPIDKYIMFNLFLER